MRFSNLVLGVLAAVFLAGCVASDSGSVLQPQVSQSQIQPAPQTAPQQPEIASLPTTQPVSNTPATVTAGATSQPTSFVDQNAVSSGPQAPIPTPSTNGSVSFATGDDIVEPILRPRNQKTYLINGLASSVGSIGYGFTNLSKKIPGSVLHNYATFVESSTVIRAEVTRELKAAYRADPNVEINMIGISFGANIVTLIANDLDRAGIPVNYLVTMEGPAMVPIRDNVRKADNFSCTNLDCFRTKSRLSWGNNRTEFQSFKIKASHIPLANHPQVHRRILSVLRERPDQIFANQ